MITSYAQNFEDIILWRALRDVSPGFFIDVGGQDPEIDSVSLAFHEKGWRGVHVEPNPSYAERLRSARPGDEIIQAAVSTQPDELRFFVLDGTGQSTTLASLADTYRAGGHEVREVMVPATTLAAQLDRHAGRDIHWLKVDVEGAEADVIESWGSSAVRPWIVLVEAIEPTTRAPTHGEWEPALLSRGYCFVYSDGVNRYYLSERQAHLRERLSHGPNCFDDARLSLRSPLNATLASQFADLQGRYDMRARARIERAVRRWFGRGTAP